MSSILHDSDATPPIAQVIPFAPRRTRSSQGRSPSVPDAALPVERTGTIDREPVAPPVHSEASCSAGGPFDSGIATIDMPPSPPEIAEAGLYCHGHTTADRLVAVCGSQVRAGLAIDVWMRRNGKSIG